MCSSDSDEKRIVVEIFSHEEAARLRAEMKQMDERHRSDMLEMERRMQGLHRTLYDCLEMVGSLRNRH